MAKKNVRTNGADVADVEKTPAPEVQTRKTLEVVIEKPPAVPLGVGTIQNHENRLTLLEGQAKALIAVVEDLINKD